MEHRKSLVVHDLKKEQRFDIDKVLLEQGLQSYVVVPLIVRDVAIGTFNVGSQQIGRYAGVDMDFIKLVASQLAMAIDNAVTDTELQARETQLRDQDVAMAEKDVALKAVLGHIENERREYRHKICHDVKHAVGPLLDRLKRESDSSYGARFEAMEEQLDTLFARDIDGFRERFATLSSREVEIVALVRQGATTKEIAESLSLAVVTVQTHRENIRRKLGLAGKSTNLGAYLRYHASALST